MLFNLAGSINSLFVLISLYGVFLQLQSIWSRKKNRIARSTELLSLNQFSVSYFAYFSFFVYGFSVQPFNHYMVWPRLLACILVLLILLEIQIDRAQLKTKFIVSLASISLVLGLVGLSLGERVVDEGNLISTGIILAVSVALAQGYWHQIMLIIRWGKTGAIDIRMSQYILAMDCSTVFLAYTMGFDKSWPMVVLAFVSGVTKLIIMYLFRWVRLSPVAAVRRQILSE